MLANMRAREAVRNKNKVSKKPEMPMIIAAEVSYHVGYHVRYHLGL